MLNYSTMANNFTEQIGPEDVTFAHDGVWYKIPNIVLDDLYAEWLRLDQPKARLLFEWQVSPEQNITDLKKLLAPIDQYKAYILY